MATTGQFTSEIDTRYRNGIWWLASYPKSGSTWVRMFFNCAITRFPVNLNAQYQYVTGDLLGHLYQSASALPLNEMGLREAIYLRPAALINALALNRGRDVCLKTHHANHEIDTIPMCPAKLSKGAVYLVRDPRDVAVSFAKHLGKTLDETIDLMGREGTCLQSDGNLLSHYLSSWSAHVRSWLSKDNPIPTSCVRYEDLLENPSERFRAILGALGLDEHVDEAAFQFAMEQTAFANLQATEDKTGFRETGRKQDRFFNAGRAGRWREVLTHDQVRRLEADHADVMSELGYHPT